MSSSLTRIDPHVKIIDDQVVQRAKHAGIDAVIYAPHFTRLPEIERRAIQFSDDDLLVIPGREIFTGTWRNRKHVLAIGLTDPIPDYISLAGAMQELDRQDATVLVPHPTFASVSFSNQDIKQYRDQLHAVETYNPKHFSYHNRNAQRISQDHDLPVFASSYAHLQGTVGEVWTEFPETPVNEQSIIHAFRRGCDRSIGHNSGVTHWVKCVLEFSHLFYENTLLKLWYSFVATRGTLPTHPLYAGRFDSVSVY